MIHNAAFDLGFLNAELARLGFPPLTNKFVDTVSIARRKYPGAPKGAHIFRAFDSLDQGLRAACDDANDLLRRGTERGRALGRVEHAKPARSARADVKQPAAGPQPIGDHLDRLGDRGGLFADGCRDGCVFPVH